jgi:hypothetical protein
MPQAFNLTAALNLQLQSRSVSQVRSQIDRGLRGMNPTVGLNVDAAGVRKLAAMNAEMAAARRQVQGLTGETDQLGRAFERVALRGAAFTVVGTAIFGLTRAIREGITQAALFEQQLSRLGQLGLPVREVRGVADEVDRLSRGLGISVNSLADAAVRLRRAGVAGTDLQQTLQTVARASLSPVFGDLTDSANVAVGALREFGTAARNLDRELAVLHGAMLRSGLDAKDVGDAISHSGRSFKEAGGDVASFVAILEVARRTSGMHAAEIADSLRGLFERLQRPQTTDRLKALGVDLAGLGGDPATAIQRLGEALKGLRAGDARLPLLASELGGMERIDKLAPLLRNAGELQRELNVATLGAVPVEQAAAASKDLLIVRLRALNEQVMSLFRSIESGSGFRLFADSLLTAANAALKLAEYMRPLLPLLTAAAAVRITQSLVGVVRGRVPAFAAGGVVPGVGDTDSVHSLLAPGEFVIRKQAARAIGYDRLVALNAGIEPERYASGGTVRLRPGLHIGQLYYQGTEGGRSSGVFPLEGNQGFQRQLRGVLGLKRPEDAALIAKRFVLQGDVDDHKLAPDRVEPVFRNEVVGKVLTAINDALNQNVPAKLRPFKVDYADSKGAMGRLEGYLLEKFISALTGVNAATGNENWDFKTSTRQLARFEGLFQPQPVSARYLDAKRTKQPPDALLRKAANEGIYQLGPENVAFAQQLVANLPKLYAQHIEEAEQHVAQLRSQAAQPHAFGGLVQRMATTSGENVAAFEGFLTKLGLPPIEVSHLVRRLYAGRTAPPEFGRVIGAYERKSRTAFVKLGAAIPAGEAAAHEILGHAADEVAGRALGSMKAASVLPGTLQSRLALAAVRQPFMTLAGPASYMDYASQGPETILKESLAFLVQGYVRRLMAQRGLTALRPQEEALFAKASTRKLFAAVADELIPDIARLSQLKLARVPSERNYAPYVDRLVGDRAAVARFAAGGAASDTVPALLTPGEFVFSREAAQRIGYGALHRMNNVRGYATGGVVRMADGGDVYGLAPEARERRRIARLRRLEREPFLEGEPYGLLPEDYIPEADTLPSPGRLRRPFRFAPEDTPTPAARLRGMGLPSPARRQRARLDALADRLTAEERLAGGVGLGQRLVEFGPTAGLLLASYVPSASEALFGRPDHALLPGQAGRAQFGATVGGLAQGAVVGASLGSLAGPWGTAIGAAAGGALGAAQAFKDAERQIRDAKIGQALTQFGDHLNQLAQGDRGVTALAESMDDLHRVRSLSRGKAVAESTGFFGTLDVQAYREASAKELRANLGPQVATLVQLLNQSAEAIGKANTGRRSTDLLSEFAAAGFNREALGALADLNRKPVRQVEDQFLKVVESAQRSQRLTEQDERIRPEVEHAAASFGRLAAAVEGASASLLGFQHRATVIADIAAGQLAPTKLTGVTETLAHFGNPNAAGFNRTVSGILAPLGQSGRELAQTNAALNQLGNVLPQTLAQTLAGNPLDSEAFGVRLRQRLEATLGGPDGMSAELKKAVAHVVNRADEMSLEDLRRGTLFDVGKLSGQLMQDFQPVHESTLRIGKAMEEGANRVIEGLAHFYAGQERVGQERDRLAVIELERLRNRARVTAEATGRPGAALDLLPLQGLERPFVQRQQRLAGAISLDPAAIARRLDDVSRQVVAAADRQREAFEKFGPASKQFAEAADALEHLKLEAINLTQAQRNLTDVSQRAAPAYEKLAHVNADRDSRLSFGERFITADVAQRLQLSRGLSMVGVAARMGTLEGFAQPDQRLILETLSGLGRTKLTGLGGVRADDLRRQLVESFGGGVFRLDAGAAGEKTRLEATISRYFEEAEKAQKGLTDNSQKLQGNFFTELRSLQNDFFVRLERSALLERKTAAESDMGATAEQQRRLTVEQGQAGLLARAGITSQSQLDRLRGRRDDVARLFEAQANAEAVEPRFEPFLDRLHPERVEKLLRAGLKNLNLYNTVRSPFGQDVASGDESARTFLGALQQAGFNQEEAADIYGGFTGRVRRKYAAFNPASVIKREITNGSLPVLLRQSIEQAMEQRTALPTDGLKNLTGLDPQGRKAFLEALGNQTLNLDTLGQRAADAANNVKALTDRLAELTDIDRGVAHKAGGGSIFAPRGTDTVPAMLTPGEYVVNARSAALHRGLLESINRGSHYADGGTVPPKGFFGRVLDAFSGGLDPVGTPLRLGMTLAEQAAVAYDRYDRSKHETRYRAGGGNVVVDDSNPAHPVLVDDSNPAHPVPADLAYPPLYAPKKRDFPELPGNLRRPLGAGVADAPAAPAPVDEAAVRLAMATRYGRSGGLMNRREAVAYVRRTAGQNFALPAGHTAVDARAVLANAAAEHARLGRFRPQLGLRDITQIVPGAHRLGADPGTVLPHDLPMVGSENAAAHAAGLRHAGGLQRLDHAAAAGFAPHGAAVQAALNQMPAGLSHDDQRRWAAQNLAPSDYVRWRRVQGFAQGGSVGMAPAGPGPGVAHFADGGFVGLGDQMTSWNGTAMALTKALEAMPHQISMQSQSQHSVNLAGGESMSQALAEALKPMFTQVVEGHFKNMMKTTFGGDAGPVL